MHKTETAAAVFFKAIPSVMYMKMWKLCSPIVGYFSLCFPGTSYALQR